MVSAWRIVKRRHARRAFDGEGAQLYGGRWNGPGVRIVYTAESRSLAALEMVAHLDSPELLGEYVVFEVSIPEAIIAFVDSARLPKHWRDNPPPPEVQAIGDAWVRAGTSAVLRTPSATLPAESNYLLNPRHPDFRLLRIGRAERFLFDPRLAKRTQ